MKITHNTKTGKTTIVLSELETRQIRSITPEGVGQIVKRGVDDAVIWAINKPLDNNPPI
jgi:hypothetical protein